MSDTVKIRRLAYACALETGHVIEPGQVVEVREEYARILTERAPDEWEIVNATQPAIAVEGD